jgi:hypothetical protein
MLAPSNRALTRDPSLALARQKSERAQTSSAALAATGGPERHDSQLAPLQKEGQHHDNSGFHAR